MSILKSILFGIVEGITEWIPVSSTAHLKIVNELCPLGASTEFYSVFEVVIQLGAIIALVIVFWKKIWPFGETKKPLGPGLLKYVKKDKFFLWLKIAVSCIPVIVYKLFVDDYVTFVNEENELFIISISLIVVGIVFVVVEALIKNKKPIIEKTKDITFTNAIIIGLVQLIAAIFPGVSRSGATIIAALLMSISRLTATEYTFELAIPTMLGASLMEVLDFGLNFTLVEVFTLLVGCIVAFAVSLFFINFILNYIRKNSFTIFGIYRVLLGIVIILFLI